MPARSAVPTSVPKVSNSSTKVKVAIADTIPVCMMPSQSNSIKFSCVKSGTQGVCGLLSELKSTAPIRIATSVVPRIPNRIAPRT
ncbi:hypothetical protein D3C76_1484610 [compost metagenome]